MGILVELYTGPYNTQVKNDKTFFRFDVIVAIYHLSPFIRIFHYKG